MISNTQKKVYIIVGILVSILFITAIGFLGATLQNSKPSTENNSETESVSKIETESVFETESGIGVETESESNLTEIESEIESKPESEKESESETESETKSETEPESEPEIESEPETESETETEAESESESESEMEIESETESESQTPMLGDAFQFAQSLGAGINIGNTMEAYGNGTFEDITGYETGWHNPVITADLMKLIKSVGFSTVRIPITWQEHIQDDGTIDPRWLNRVKEVVDMARAEDLYVIINIHHDQWVITDYANLETVLEKTECVWGQIAAFFKDYDNKLIFEGFNEPRLLGYEEEWGFGTEEAYDVINQMMAKFVETVRNAGGNNAERYLMISGYCSTSHPTILKKIEIPKDDYLLLSIHAYHPYNFAQNPSGTDEWNIEDKDSTSELDWLFPALKKYSEQYNIPIVITEFGAIDKGNDESRENWCTYYVNRAIEVGIPYIWWDNNYYNNPDKNYALLDRQNNVIVNPKLVDILTKK